MFMLHMSEKGYFLHATCDNGTCFSAIKDIIVFDVSEYYLVCELLVTNNML